MLSETEKQKIASEQAVETLRNRDKNKSAAIKRLSNQVVYHMNKRQTLKDLTQELRAKDFISPDAEDVLNVIK